MQPGLDDQHRDRSLVVCYRVLMLKHLLFVFLMLFALVTHAGRFLPQNVQIGQINGHHYPDVKIGGETYRLAPGVRIYDTFNRTIVPNQSGGFLIKIWLPTPEEEAGMGR